LVERQRETDDRVTRSFPWMVVGQPAGYQTVVSGASDGVLTWAGEPLTTKRT
jgi:hypothetical protein